MRALSLFSGAGGGALALQRAGYDPTLCLERDADACATLRANGVDAWQCDITQVDWSIFTDFGADVILGGPPCQPFSQSGKHKAGADARDCIPDFARAVRELRPRVFVMENVRGLTYPRHRDYLRSVLEGFPEEYTVDHRVLNAADYGVPQTRHRLFVIGRLDGVPVWPEPSVSVWVSMAEALGIPDDTILHTNRFQRPDGTRQTVPTTQPAPTLTTRSGSQWKLSTDQKLLPVELLARVQGFPEGWTFAGTKTSVHHQIGNACPPALLEAVVSAQTVRVPAAQ